MDIQKFGLKVGMKNPSSIKILKFLDFSRILDKMLKFPDFSLICWSNIKFPDFSRFSRLHSNPVQTLISFFNLKFCLLVTIVFFRYSSTITRLNELKLCICSFEIFRNRFVLKIFVGYNL